MRRLLLLPALALALTGCSPGSEDSSAAAEAGSAAPPAAAQDLAESGAGGGTTAESLPPLASVALAGEAVVRTAELDVRVDDVRSAADRAGAVAREAGGSVVSERADLARGGVASAELVLRVPPEQLDAALTALAGLGEEQGRAVSSEEVGEQLVDLETRLAAQRASVDRVRTLLEEADDLAQIVQVEGELTRRTADLESLQARLTALRDRVRLSTLTLRLHDSDGPGAAGGDLPGFLDGLRGGWAALLAVGAVLAATAGAVLPFLPVVAVLVWAAARARRRRGAVPA